MPLTYAKWTTTLMVAAIWLTVTSVGDNAVRMQSAWGIDLNSPAQSKAIGTPDDQAVSKRPSDESLVPPLPIPAEDGPVPNPAGSLDGSVEVLTHGPVHEAFAEPIGADPQPSQTVAKRPPAEIEEVPPDVKPEGENVIWVPGYWAWDDEREDYLWVSGIWRKVPPGRRWVPGYWADTEDKWQWISGLWTPTDVQELDYHEMPPESLEAGPNRPAPGDGYFWAPGCWTWHDTGHRWRPGYWMPYDADRVWVAAQWVWTPRGCLFVPGYWDYRVTCRGHLFAPVRFHASVIQRPHFRFTPWCVLDCRSLLVHLWIRPSYGHYYFGDYYGTRAVALDFVPWCHWHGHSRRWDPILTHFQVHYRKHYDIDYIQRMGQWHRFYQSKESDRPPRTFQEQLAFSAGKPGNSAVKRSLLAVKLDDLAGRGHGAVRLEVVSQAARKSFVKEAHLMRKSAHDRISQEKMGLGVDRKAENSLSLRNQKWDNKSASTGQFRGHGRVSDSSPSDLSRNGDGHISPSRSLSIAPMSRGNESHSSGQDKPHTFAHGNSARSRQAERDRDSYHLSRDDRSGAHGNSRPSRSNSMPHASRGSGSYQPSDAMQSAGGRHGRSNSSNNSRGKRR